MDGSPAALPEDGRVITWGEAEFTISKMLPVEAKAVFLAHVRPLLRGALADMPAPDKAEKVSPIKELNDILAPENAIANWRLFAAMFIEAPYDHYAAISTAMAGSIMVRRGRETRPLRGNEAWAFQGLEGAHGMLLDGRAFLVNFQPWFSVLMQESAPLMQAFTSLNLQTSTLSSGTSSPPTSG